MNYSQDTSVKTVHELSWPTSQVANINMRERERERERERAHIEIIE